MYIPEMEREGQKQFFRLKDNCLWIRDNKFSESLTGYLSLADNVLQNTRKI